MAKSYLRDRPAQHLVARNARSSPFHYDRQHMTVSGCLYDAKGAVIALSQRTSGVGGDRVTNADPAQWDDTWRLCRRVTEPCLYMGHLMAHYGHFITESLSTFWALPFAPDNCRLVFHPFTFGAQTQAFMAPFFEAFGISADRISVLDEPTQFEQIHIPERSFHLNAHFNARYVQTLSTVRSALELEGKPRRRIFLSRSKCPPVGRAYSNAAATDELMTHMGLEVVHPERMSIREQLSLYASTELAVGFSGSALHNCLFMPDSARLIEIGDRRSPNKVPPTQQMCNEVSGLKASFIPAWTGWSRQAEDYDLQYLTSQLLQLAPCLHAART